MNFSSLGRYSFSERFCFIKTGLEINSIRNKTGKPNSHLLLTKIRSLLIILEMETFLEMEIRLMCHTNTGADFALLYKQCLPFLIN